MEYLNDEKDDLFRKAGEHYPLKTTDSDWEGVLGRLQPQAGGESASFREAGVKRNNKKRFFWLLLLLPLSLISIKYLPGSEGKKNTYSKNPTSVMPLKNTENNHAGSALHNVPANSPNIKIPSPEKIQPGHILSHGQTANTKVNNPSGKGPLAMISSTGPERSLYANKNIKTNTSKPGITKESPGSSPDGNKEDRVASAREQDADIKKENTAILLPGKNSVVRDNTNHAVKPRQIIPDKTATDQTSSSQKNIKPAKALSAKEKGIYFSLVAAPDFSTVKFQSVKNMGYSIGLLAGYRFNKHISAETGVFWDKKQYYSDGEYFNKSKTDIPPSVDILDVNGNCNMFEIPVRFRYDFSFSRKGRFFSTAGLSTYIMKKENYTYDAESYGSGWSQQVSYHNSGNNLFSILQVSAGYEYNLGKAISLRIEPYFKIPLAGVGIGSLPISSAGIEVGITPSFH